MLEKTKVKTAIHYYVHGINALVFIKFGLLYQKQEAGARAGYGLHGFLFCTAKQEIIYYQCGFYKQAAGVV